MKSHLEDYGITVCTLNEFSSDKAPNQFDLIWSTHWPLFARLVNYRTDLQWKKLVQCTMSPVLDIESIIFFIKETDLVVFQAASNKRVQMRYIETQVPDPKINILPNPYRLADVQGATRPLKSLKKAIFISNYTTSHVFELQSQLLEKHNVTLDIFGSVTEQKLITAEVIDEYDLLISIGRTCQLGLLRKIPVYIFGRFGTDGYITADNMEELVDRNFTGNVYGFQYSVDELIADISTNYERAVNDVDDLCEKALSQFIMEPYLDAFIDDLGADNGYRTPEDLSWGECYLALKMSAKFVNSPYLYPYRKIEVSRMEVVKETHHRILLFNVDTEKKELVYQKDTQVVSVTGVLLLKEGDSFHFRINSPKEYQVSVTKGIKSPGVKNKFPHLAISESSRFEILVKIETAVSEPIEIFCVADDEEFPLAGIHIIKVI